MVGALCANYHFGGLCPMHFNQLDPYGYFHDFCLFHRVCETYRDITLLLYLYGACCLANRWDACSATHRSHRCIAVAPLCLCLGCRVVHRLYRLCDRHDHHQPRLCWKYLYAPWGQAQCSCRCGLSYWRRVGPGLARCCRHRRCSACSGGRRDGAFFLRCPARLSHCFARLYRLCGCWQVSRVCEGGARCAPLGALALGSRLMMSRARLC